MLTSGDAAITFTGMPVEHGRAFQEVANTERSVIACRAVGYWATGLLLESYATKGFHNKAKSCPWGPMAGFVMADPRFTKNPDLEGQRRSLVEAIGHHADTTPLYITNDRLKDLEGPLNAMERIGGNINEKIYSAVSPKKTKMKFILRREFNGPGADGKQLWSVHYHPDEIRLSNDLTSANKSTGGGSLPLMAMVDAACPPNVKKTYRAATTGDYDLYAVFPRRASYNRAGADKRMVPGSDRFQLPIKVHKSLAEKGVVDYVHYEDEHLGNLTPRIAAIRLKLNAAVAGTGYTGGDVVHHSDEAGRPRLSDIDFPYVAFVPGDTAYLVKDVGEFRLFIGKVMREYVMSFNPGWHRQLGFTVTSRGNYEV